MVASVNGRSGFIAPDGTVVAGIEPRTRTVLARDVPLVQGVPPSMVVGPWLGRAAVGAALVAVLWALLPYRRRRKSAPEVPAREKVAVSGQSSHELGESV